MGGMKSIPNTKLNFLQFQQKMQIDPVYFATKTSMFIIFAKRLHTAHTKAIKEDSMMVMKHLELRKCTLVLCRFMSALSKIVCGMG